MFPLCFIFPQLEGGLVEEQGSVPSVLTVTGLFAAGAKCIGTDPDLPFEYARVYNPRLCSRSSRDTFPLGIRKCTL